MTVRDKLRTSIMLLESITREANGHGMMIDWRKDGLFIDGRQVH